MDVPASYINNTLQAIDAIEIYDENVHKLIKISVLVDSDLRFVYIFHGTENHLLNIQTFKDIKALVNIVCVASPVGRPAIIAKLSKIICKRQIYLNVIIEQSHISIRPLLVLHRQSRNVSLKSIHSLEAQGMIYLFLLKYFKPRAMEGNHAISLLLSLICPFL